MTETTPVRTPCGNAHVSRALEVAAAGGHTVALIGPVTAPWEEVLAYAEALGVRVTRSAWCRCGYSGDPKHSCLCGGPSRWLVRLRHLVACADLAVEVACPTREEVIREVAREFRDETTADVSGRIADLAENLQNSWENSWPLTEGSLTLLKAGIDRLGFSLSATRRAVAVARTIQALDGFTRTPTVDAPAIAEAIQYRCVLQHLGF